MDDSDYDRAAASPGDETALEHALAAPDQRTIDALTALPGDVVILGAGGKMGPTIARMARRAIGDRARRVFAVSRFSDPAVADALSAAGVEVIRADLSDPKAVAALPDAALVVWMAGQKFGTANDPVGAWTHNVVASVHAAERYAGARIVCFSTGNVYGPSAVGAGGSREADELRPDGNYAISCLGRERVFAAVARRTGSPLLLYRLFYACDLRYGVVTDLALKVLQRQPISLATTAVNVIWQGDANRLALRALACATVPTASTPPLALNVTGPVVTIHDLANRLAAIAEIPPHFVDAPSDHALIANVDMLSQLLPYEAVSLQQLCERTIAWIRADGRLLHKPTKFEVRDGRF